MSNAKFVSVLFCLFMLAGEVKSQPGEQQPGGYETVDSNKPVAEISFELKDNLIYLPVSVSGSVMLNFILDGGSSFCMVDSAAAEKLQLTGAGEGLIHGAGTGAVKVKYLDSLVYGLAGTSTLVGRSDIVNLAGAVPGQKVDGLLGYEFFLKYVVEIDYPKRVLRLFQPENYRYMGRGSVVPLIFHKKLVYFMGQIKLSGQPYVKKEYLIDTGSSDVIDDETIKESQGNKKEVLGGVGLGQQFTIIEAKVEEFKIGKLSLKNLDGVSGGYKIGSGLLSRYRVTFDYSRSRMIVE
jgi:hypothetical protein